MQRPAHITVCVCTYRRPDLLERLLAQLCTQAADGLFTQSVVVVDNDEKRSAVQTIEKMRSRAPFAIEYDCEPVRNIAMARNRSVDLARGDLLAFIDDDEWPGPTWLLTMYRVLAGEQAVAGVLGPVMPSFEADAPTWLIKARFHEKTGPASGTVLHWKQTRTSNVLMRRALLEDPTTRFDVRFGKGGEDVDLFKRLIDRGHRFVWCSEATVFETIPAERCTRTYLLRRALLRGQGTAKYHGLGTSDLLKSTVAVPLYLAAMPVASLAGHHHLMKLLSKTAEHAARLLAVVGIELVKDY